MGAEKNLISRLKQDLGHHPVVSNLVFGFVMAGVEKMLEVEFACPCNPTWNAIFVAPFFLIPAATASGLMVLIHGCGCKVHCLYSLLPPIVWLALMLLDGQYVVCAETDWPGTFVSTSDTYLKWCTPTNTTASLTKELLNRSHRFYILSQGIGNAIFLFLLVVLIVYMVCTKGGKQPENGEKPGQNDEEELDSPETHHLQASTNV